MMKKILSVLVVGFSLSIWSCGDPTQQAGKDTAEKHEADNAGQNEEGYNVTPTESLGEENVQTREDIGTSEINSDSASSGNVGESGTDTIGSSN